MTGSVSYPQTQMQAFSVSAGNRARTSQIRPEFVYSLRARYRDTIALARARAPAPQAVSHREGGVSRGSRKVLGRLPVARDADAERGRCDSINTRDRKSTR